MPRLVRKGALERGIQYAVPLVCITTVSEYWIVRLRGR